MHVFFDDHRTLGDNSPEYKTAIRVLNYLEKCFPAESGPYSCLEKHAWVLAVYMMIRELQVGYSLIGQEGNVLAFVQDFHGKVYNEDFRRSKTDYQRFYDNVRGGWTEKIVALRRDILIKEFLNKHNVLELDDKRQISDEEKIAIFSVHPKCEMCSRKFKNHKDAEYHHKELYSEGGKTKQENIMVLCPDCHDLIHGRRKIESLSEKEVAQEEEE